MPRGKRPVRMTGLRYAHAPWSTMHPQDGELPRCFRMEFRDVTGPAGVNDGRALIAVLTPAELAEALGAIPARTLTGDDDNLRALMRIIRLLKGETS